MVATKKQLRPNGKVLAATYNLTCSRVYNLAKYVAYRSTDQIVFGKRRMSLAEFCKEWEGFMARTFQVIVFAGPPHKKGYYRLTLDQLVTDWYFDAIRNGNHYMVARFEEALG